MEGKSFPKARRFGSKVLSAVHADDRRMLGELWDLSLGLPIMSQRCTCTRLRKRTAFGNADAQSNAFIQ